MPVPPTRWQRLGGRGGASRPVVRTHSARTGSGAVVKELQPGIDLVELPALLVRQLRTAVARLAL